MKNKISIKCEECGAEKLLRPSEAKGRRFCGKACFVIFCKRTGPYRGNKALARKEKWRRKHLRSLEKAPLRKCEFCDTTFPAYPKSKRFCGPKCVGKWLTKYRVGEKHHAWQGGMRAAVERYRKREPEKSVARMRIRDAVAGGKLKKPSFCSMCGAPKQKHELDGHHPDYSKPLEVVWVCRWCHKQIHKGLRAENSGNASRVEANEPTN